MLSLNDRAQALMDGNFYKLAAALYLLEGYDEVDSAQLATAREAAALRSLDEDAERAEAR